MQKKVWFRNNKGQRLAGILHIPKGKGSFPAVIVCHGFKGYKDQKMMVEISKALAKAGILALRFDFAGSGESEGEFEDISVSSVGQEVQDLHSATRFVKSLKKVDKKRIGVTGHSLGGGVCFMETARNKNIKTMVGIAPTIDRKGWIKQYERQGRVQYYQRFFLLDGRRIKNRFIKEGSFRIYSLAKKVKIPILVIQGDKDRSVGCNIKCATKFLKGVSSAKRLVRIKGGVHMFSKKRDFNRMVNLTVSWFKKYLI